MKIKEYYKVYRTYKNIEVKGEFIMEFTSDDVFLLMMLSKQEDYDLVLDKNKILPKIKEVGDLYLEKESFNFEDNISDLANKITNRYVAYEDYEFLDSIQGLNFSQRINGLLLYPLVKFFYDLKNPIDAEDKYIFKPLSDKAIYELIDECNTSGVLNQAFDDFNDIENIYDNDIAYLN
jgi:hypothetical protein